MAGRARVPLLSSFPGLPTREKIPVSGCIPATWADDRGRMDIRIPPRRSVPGPSMILLPRVTGDGSGIPGQDLARGLGGHLHRGKGKTSG